MDLIQVTNSNCIIFIYHVFGENVGVISLACFQLTRGLLLRSQIFILLRQRICGLIFMFFVRFRLKSVSNFNKMTFNKRRSVYHFPYIQLILCTANRQVTIMLTFEAKWRCLICPYPLDSSAPDVVAILAIRKAYLLDLSSKQSLKQMSASCNNMPCKRNLSRLLLRQAVFILRNNNLNYHTLILSG